MEKITQRIYLDNASTTPISAEVYRAMLDCMQENFGNASSLHSFGRDAANAIETAREQIAKAIGAKPSEIYFTSGGSESDNWALKGVALANKDKGNHIVVSAVEHPAILESCKSLEKLGFEVTIVPVDKFGTIKYAELIKAIGPKTILVSVMTANNEVGTIQPIRAISEFTKANKVLFHTDAVQAVGAVPINVNDLGIDLMSLSGHKINGPKGVGVLYVRKGTKIGSFIDGGHQEMNKRAGTQNTPAIVGMGKAVEIACRDQEKNATTLRNIRRYFWRQVRERIPNVSLNGDPKNRLPGNAHITFEGIEGESILMLLDLAGIAVSTGSACASGTLEPSHVLMAMGFPEETAHSSIRFTFSKNITPGEVDYAVNELEKVVKKLRKISPIKIKKNKEDK